MEGDELSVEDTPAPEDIQALRRGLSDFNAAQTGQRGQLISVFLRDDQRRIVGGTHGWTASGWLHTDVLWLKEDIRRKGLGRQVLEATEAEAKRRGCNVAELQTFRFQGPEFYKKNGYTVFAELDQVAVGHHWYFLKKSLS